MVSDFLGREKGAHFFNAVYSNLVHIYAHLRRSDQTYEIIV